MTAIQRLWEDGTWFGTRYDASDIREAFEVQLNANATGHINAIRLSRAYREFAIEIARSLGLVVFDPQAAEIIEP